MKYVPTCDTGRGKSMTQKFHSFESRNAIKAQILYFALIPQKIHAKFHVNRQGFFNMASDAMPAVLPANQMPCLKIFANWTDFNMEMS